MFGSLPLRVMDHLSVLYLSSTWSFCTFKDTTAIYLIFFFFAFAEITIETIIYVSENQNQF